MKNYEISASILSADFARLGEDVVAMLAGGAHRVHIDAMDNHYVPNLTVGPLIPHALRDYGITAPMDAHLMIEPVDNMVKAFAKAGVNRIIFHPEASRHIDRTLQLIQECGCEAGLALNPATPLNYLDFTLDKLSVVLLMTVNPGFGGQHFMPEMLTKITQVAALIKQSPKSIRLEVDGGVKVDNIHSIAAAGADTFCIGSGLFGEKDYKKTLENLLKCLTK